MSFFEVFYSCITQFNTRLKASNSTIHVNQQVKLYNPVVSSKNYTLTDYINLFIIPLNQMVTTSAEVLSSSKEKNSTKLCSVL